MKNKWICLIIICFLMCLTACGAQSEKHGDPNYTDPAVEATQPTENETQASAGSTGTEPKDEATPETTTETDDDAPEMPIVPAP